LDRPLRHHKDYGRDKNRPAKQQKILEGALAAYCHINAIAHGVLLVLHLQLCWTGFRRLHRKSRQLLFIFAVQVLLATHPTK
jgi:hypothetical protein